MDAQELRQLMVEQGRSLFQRGFTTGGGGNLSLKLPNGNILSTPTGSSLGRLNAETLSEVALDGTHISGDRPSKEAGFHLAIYRSNPAINGIVHLHSTYLTALSARADLDPDNAIRAFTPYYVMRIGQLPVVPYFKPGAKELESELAKHTANGKRAVLLANHGPVVTGHSFLDAVDNAEELEETARLHWLLRNEQVNYLNEEQITQLQKMKK